MKRAFETVILSWENIFPANALRTGEHLSSVTVTGWEMNKTASHYLNLNNYTCQMTIAIKFHRWVLDIFVILVESIKML